MSKEWQRVREAFEQICDLDASERKAKLAGFKEEDPKLYAGVESLLASYDEGAIEEVVPPLACHPFG